MSEADVQASAATIESPTINGGGENGLTKKPLEGADTLDAPIASGGTGEKGANGTLDAALTEGKEALSEVVTAAVKEVNGVNGDLGNVAVNGLLIDAKDDEVKVGETTEDLSSSKNEEPVNVSEPSHAEANSSEDAANDVLKAEENSVVAPATDATEVVLSKKDEPVAGAVPEAEQTTDASSSPTDTPTQVTNVESIVEATQAPTVEASEPVTAVDVPEDKVIALTVEETALVNEEPTPSVAVDATEPVPPTQTPAPAEVVEAPVAVEEPTPKIASPQVVAADIPAEETLPALSAATAEPEPEVVPEAVIAPIEDVPITVDVQTAPEAPIPEATEVPPIADSAPEATTVAASKPIDIEALVKEEPIKEIALPVVNESSPESTEEVSAKPDVVEVVEETESAQVATPEAPPAEAIVEGLAPAVEELKVAAEAPLVEATPAEESSTVVAVEEPVEPTEEPAEKVDVPVVEELKPADVFESAAPVAAEVAQAPPDLVDEEVKPALEGTEPVVETVESIEEAKPVVEEKAVVEEVVPAAVDDMKDEKATSVSEEKPAEEPVEAAPIVEDEKPVVHEVAPEIVTEAPIVEEISVVEETEPVVADEEPIIKEESLVREAEVVEEATPLVQEEATVIEEKPAAEEAKLPVQEEVEAVVEEKPIVQEEPAVQDIATVAEEETPVAQLVVAPEPEPVVENPEPAQEPKAVDDVTLVEEAAKPAEDPKVEEANEDAKPLDATALPDDDVSPPVLKEEEEPTSTAEEANPVEATNVDVTKTVEEEAKPAVDDAPAEPTPLVENPKVTDESVASKAVDEGPEPAKEDPAPIVVEAVAEAEPTSSPPVETISEEVEPAIHVTESLPVSEPEPAESAPANSVAVVAADEDSTDVKPTVEEAKVVTEVEDVPPTEKAQPVQEDDKVDEEVKVPEPEVLLSTPTTIVEEETTQDASSDEQASLVGETKSETEGAEEKVADEVNVPTHDHAEVVTAASEEKSESTEAPSEVAPTEPVSEESTDSPSVILNVDSAASDPEVEEPVVVPIEEEMVFAPREEEVKSPKEKRSTSIDVVGEASAEETTADVVSPPTDPSEPPIVIVDEPAISAEEVPRASEVTNDPIERPKSPWTPSYSVMQVGSGVEVVDQISEEVAPDPAITAVPNAEPSELQSERPSSTWTPSYSTTSQGSRSPSPLPDVEDPATEPSSEATAAEDVPIVTETTSELSADTAEPPSIMITPQPQSDEVEVPPALEIETKVEQDIPERPKSPWTPSYSVTTQVPPPVGEVVDLPVPEVAVSIAEPQPVDADIVEPVSSHEEIAEPVFDVEPLSVSSSSTDEPEEVQHALSPSLHVTLADVPEPTTIPEQPAAPEILSTSLSRSKSADSLTPDDNLERPKSPWTPSYSVTSQGSPNLSPQVLTEEPPSIEVGTGADVESVPTVETPAQPSVDPSPVEAIIAPVPERPKSPWTPSYSVTRQGSTPPSPQPAPAPAPTELVVNADIDAQSDIAAASLATEGPSSPRSALADLDSDTFSDVSDQRIPDSEETQPTVVESDVDNPQEVEAASRTPVLSSAQLTAEVVTTPTEEVPEPSVTITVDEPVVESNPQTPRNEPSEEPQAFPSNTKPTVSRLDTSGEPHELDTSLSTLETPAQSRKRLESTASSRFFPGGWFSTSPTIGGRTSLENAQGEFSALKSPIDMAGTTAPATTPVDGLAEDEERKSRWCTIM
ncbi:hypothetical protein AB1N83_001782 [Pleurotus pulmonarius]